MIKNVIIGILSVALLGIGAWYYFTHLDSTLIEKIFTRLDSTPIEKILKNPRAYDGKVITISGEVTNRTSLVLLKFFTLKDKTGEITVITKRSLPAIGAKETVKGKVEEAFVFGDKQKLVFVEMPNN